MALDEAIEHDAGPTVVRFPKTPLGHDLPPVRQVGGVDVLAEPDVGASVDVLVVSIGSLAYEVLGAAARVREAGFTIRVVDPRWVNPIPRELVDLARAARLIVSVEDGVVASGVGARVAQALRASGVDTPSREVGIPVAFLDHGKVAEVRIEVGFTAQDIGRRIVEWTAQVERADADRLDSEAVDPMTTD